AGLASVTVPVAGWPPVMLWGAMLSDATVPVSGVPADGSTDTGVLNVLALVAITLPSAATVTGSVVMAKSALGEPGGSVTVAGTLTLGMVLERPTETPFAPAGFASVTVPVAGCPPVIIGGLTLIVARTPASGCPCGVEEGLIVSGVLMEFALVTLIVP